jgi:hypothetical protein
LFHRWRYMTWGRKFCRNRCVNSENQMLNVLQHPLHEKWTLLNILMWTVPEIHLFSKNLGATSKFYVEMKQVPYRRPKICSHVQAARLSGAFCLVHMNWYILFV